MRLMVGTFSSKPIVALLGHGHQHETHRRFAPVNHYLQGIEAPVVLVYSNAKLHADSMASETITTAHRPTADNWYQFTHHFNL